MLAEIHAVLTYGEGWHYVCEECDLRREIVSLARLIDDKAKRVVALERARLDEIASRKRAAWWMANQ